MKNATADRPTYKVLNEEAQFLIQCLNDDLDPEDQAYLNLDTVAFLDTLENHRLTAVFWNATKNSHLLPDQLKNELIGLYSDKRIQILKHVAELCKVTDRLKTAGIDTVALKGPMVSHQYYGDFSLRECNDLDILVKPHNIQAAYDILVEMGYELTEVLWNTPKQKAIYHKTYHHYNLYNTSNNVMIELHWRLHFSNGVDIGATTNLWKDLTINRLGSFEVRSLSRFDTFIHLCVHGCSHLWKRMFWVQDIARLIEKEDHAFIINAYQLAVQRGVDRHVLEACNLAFVLFKADLPIHIHEAILRDNRIRKLTDIALFAIDTITIVYQSPVADWKSFLLAKSRLINHYKNTYYLGDFKAIFDSFNRFLVNPQFWNIFSFSDRWFVLNYFAAPFLWVYSVLNKNKE